ncbi:DMT family transporter [Profundibacterium mesophilum]|uniref:Membrane protein n=1 Tax=Profundibacterium mesophilum KAUST100406-0324 TaxID=1037889 RepID=A0A921NQC9_9RHOB|nr:DMT family transporter [Profundibacterium mesophilum]KAF0675440.1 putative Membrane protein [Profundibacterium mesophilum KAUST100406-0324]
MATEHFRDAAVMLAAGIGIPVLASLNAALGTRIGAPVAAGAVLFTVALGATLLVGAVTGLGGLQRLAGQPWHLFTAGFFVAFYVLTITFVAPRFGVGNAVFFVLLGQLVSAAIIDHFGLFGARQQSLTAMRALGIALMALGVFVTQKA